MAQTNVMVSYAPARFPAADTLAHQAVATVRAPRRWAPALAGMLLAGGAVFALGQFVNPDGTTRDESFPAAPRAPLAKSEPAGSALIVPPVRDEAAEAESKPLPYLALVRDVAPAPKPASAMRTLSAPAVPRHQPQRAALAASAVVPTPAAEPISVAEPATAVDAITPPAPARESGLRRDLEGFLESQGHELAVAEPSGTVIAQEGELRPELAAPLELTDAEVLPDVEPGLQEPVEMAEAVEPRAVIEVAEAAQAAPPEATQSQRLAEVASPQAAPAPEPPAIASPPKSLTATAEVAEAEFSAEPSPLYVQSYPVAVINGEPLGAVTLRDYGVDGAAIHLRALIGLLRLRMPEAEFLRLDTAAAADRFISIEELRAAGIEARFDPRNGRLTIESR